MGRAKFIFTFIFEFVMLKWIRNACVYIFVCYFVWTYNTLNMTFLP